MAAAIGTAAVIAAIASKGFEEGGYTGDGRSNGFAGMVHHGEYVMSAPAVRSIGIGNLDAMHDAGKSGAPMGGGRAAESPVHMHIHQDQASAIRAAMRGPAGRHIIADISRGTILQMSR